MQDSPDGDDVADFTDPDPELPPRHGEPLRVGAYRNHKVCIYPYGNEKIREDISNAPETVRKVFDNTWCGYVYTELDDDAVEQLRPFGGVTYHREGWVGFDTQHPGDGPESIEEMMAEVEKLVDQIITLEQEHGITNSS